MRRQTSIATRLNPRHWSTWGLTLALTALLPVLPLSAQTLSEKVVGMEQGLEQEFETYFGRDLAEVNQTPEDIAQTLDRIGQATQTKPAVLWAIPRGDHLHLVLLTATGTPIVRDLYDVPDTRLRQVVAAFQLELQTAPAGQSLPAAEQLHDWILGAYEADYLAVEGIDTILFCLGNGLRGLPLAALHDGEQFLIEKYSLTRIPAFNLIQTDYVDLQAGHILAMGASEFETQDPLPAVPTELDTILLELVADRPRAQRWVGESFLNQDFTIANLQAEITAQSPTVIHLATHAVFQSGRPADSYIQLWDQPLGLDALATIDWHPDTLELLVLSACRTAIGDDQAELGFAGVALQSGVKSVIASLWNVSDAGTLALMGEFYRQLDSSPTKAEALRQAQLRMLRGEVRVDAAELVLSRGAVPLPAELQSEETPDLAAPYYWAGFTMISSPW